MTICWPVSIICCYIANYPKPQNKNLPPSEFCGFPGGFPVANPCFSHGLHPADQSAGGDLSWELKSLGLSHSQEVFLTGHFPRQHLRAAFQKGRGPRLKTPPKPVQHPHLCPCIFGSKQTTCPPRLRGMEKSCQLHLDMRGTVKSNGKEVNRGGIGAH